MKCDMNFDTMIIVMPSNEGSKFWLPKFGREAEDKYSFNTKFEMIDKRQNCSCSLRSRAKDLNSDTSLQAWIELRERISNSCYSTPNWRIWSLALSSRILLTKRSDGYSMISNLIFTWNLRHSYLLDHVISCIVLSLLMNNFSASESEQALTDQVGPTAQVDPWS